MVQNMLNSCMIFHQGFFISLKLRKTKGLSVYSKRISQTKEKKKPPKPGTFMENILPLFPSLNTGDWDSETSVTLISNGA